MKRKLVWHLVAVLILGLALLAFSCGGTTPTEQPIKEAPAVEEPAAPTTPAETTPATTEGPPAIPHTLEGRDDCLVCHGEGAFKPFPADHAGRTSDTCTACHQPAG